MTCIVGWIEGGCVYIGGDSLGTASGHKQIRKDPKVIRVGEMVIGYTSSFRFGQLMRYMLKLPTHPEGMDTFQYMATCFVGAMLRSEGYAKRVSEQESSDGNCLVGYRGRLFQFYDDYQIEETIERFAACGHGRALALGALGATEFYSMHPAERLEGVLSVVGRFDVFVGGPSLILSTTVPPVNQLESL